jgi:predicted DsbA family dithiol-disulfide isomerase
VAWTYFASKCWGLDAHLLFLFREVYTKIFALPTPSHAPQAATSSVIEFRKTASFFNRYSYPLTATSRRKRHPYSANLFLALRLVRENPSNSKVDFTIHYFPYQLYPGASRAGEDKYEWYKKSRYGDSEEKIKMYITLMTAYGESCGIKFKFGGKVANTLPAHRVIQHFQGKQGEDTADKIINSLYRQYFEEEKHPSEEETLLTACKEAGIEEKEAKDIINDESEGLMEVKNLIREQASNGVDSVPYIVLEGKRRDVTLVGAKEVDEYVKALEQIVKESG